jgi:3-hydroxyacyl-CoA dehydrogenase/enoyl-CoA hydratase/3-hydroxybutyryl-CoA epimerase
LHVAKILSGVLRAEPPQLLVDRVAAGELGAKTARGFYAYVGGHAVKKKEFAAPDDELIDRLLLPLVNEAVACLDEDIVGDADLLDAAAVFGAGFAPFRGGPLNYARQRGYANVADKLAVLAKKYGTRFTPHEGWARLRRQP